MNDQAKGKFLKSVEEKKAIKKQKGCKEVFSKNITDKKRTEKGILGLEEALFNRNKRKEERK